MQLHELSGISLCKIVLLSSSCEHYLLGLWADTFDEWIVDRHCHECLAKDQLGRRATISLLGRENRTYMRVAAVAAAIETALIARFTPETHLRGFFAGRASCETKRLTMPTLCQALHAIDTSATRLT